MAPEPKPSQSKEPSVALDHYQAQYMAGRGAVVLHAKTRSNWHAPGLSAVSALFVVVWCATHVNLGLAMGLGLGGFIMFLGLFFAVLRVKVTTEHVDIHYGLLGPKIPLVAIESVEAVRHGHNSFLRWGISPLGRGEWLYAVAGDEGRAVKIVWRNRSGKRRVHYVGSPEHEQLAAAIEQARGLLSLPEVAARPAGDEEG